MIESLTAVPPVSTATLGSTSTPGPTAVAGPSEAPAPELVSRFEALLGQAKQAQQHRASGPSAIGELVAKEDASMKTFVEHVDTLSNIDQMRSMEEVVAVTAQLEVEAATMSWKINTASAVAQSGKSAVQTLMRNQ